MGGVRSQFWETFTLNNKILLLLFLSMSIAPKIGILPTYFFADVNTNLRHMRPHMRCHMSEIRI